MHLEGAGEDFTHKRMTTYSVFRVNFLPVKDTPQNLGLHQFQILPILQVPSTVVRCIHKYRYQYQYMEIL